LLTLIALNGQEKGREFQLTGEQPMLMGRQASTFKLTDSQTSRQHAEILLENNTWLIRDLGSTNGTWVNGQKITQITELESGDRIVLGRHQFRIGKITEAAAPSPQPKPPAPEPAIGSEELSEMGVDLGESLSADILEEEDLPTVSEDSHAHDATIQAHSPDGTQAPIDDEVPVKQSEADEDILDLDALLGDIEPPAGEPEVPDQPEPPTTAEAPPEPMPAEPSPPAESLIEEEPDEPSGQPTDPAGQDGIIDLDSLLEEAPEPETPPISLAPTILPTPAAPPAPPESTDTVEPPENVQAQEAPEPPVPPVPPQTPEVTQAPEEAELPEPSGHAGSDELIDLDILASAEPTTALHDEDDSSGKEDDVISETQAEPPPPPTDPPPSDQPADDLIDEVDDGLVDLDGRDGRETSSADSSGVSDLSDAPVTSDGPDDADREIEQADTSEQDELVPADQALLMTLDEQTEALAGYQRPRWKTLVVLVVILAGLGVAGWYTVSKYVKSADADYRQPHFQVPDRSGSPSRSESRGDTGDPLATPRAVPSLGTLEEVIEPVRQAHGQTPSPPKPDTALAPAPLEDGPISLPKTPLSPDDPLVAPSLPTPDAASDEPQGDSGQGDVNLDSSTGRPQTGDKPTGPRGVTQNALTPQVSEPQATASPQVAPTPAPPAVPDPAELTLLADAVEAQYQTSQGVADQAVFAGARRVAFIVDASGSLVDSFPYVLAELGGAMSDLPEDSAFTIIFFGSEGVVEVPPVGLRWADQQAKRRVRRWVAPANGNISAWGRGDPVKAIQHALIYQVDEICLFSDNLFGQRLSAEDAQASVNRVIGLLDGKVQQVNVVQLFDRDPHHVLKQIAQAFDGRYERVDPQITAKTPNSDPLSRP